MSSAEPQRLGRSNQRTPMSLPWPVTGIQSKITGFWGPAQEDLLKTNLLLPTTIRGVADTQVSWEALQPVAKCFFLPQGVHSNVPSMSGLSPGVKALSSCYTDSFLSDGLVLGFAFQKFGQPKTGSNESGLVPSLSQASIFPHRISVPLP